MTSLVASLPGGLAVTSLITFLDRRDITQWAAIRQHAVYCIRFTVVESFFLHISLPFND
jgi:hypothetical protein